MPNSELTAVTEYRVVINGFGEYHVQHRSVETCLKYRYWRNRITGYEYSDWYDVKETKVRPGYEQAVKKSYSPYRDTSYMYETKVKVFTKEAACQYVKEQNKYYEDKNKTAARIPVECKC